MRGSLAGHLAGTAKTHIRSIYHKMDIHTQQDLTSGPSSSAPVATMP